MGTTTITLESGDSAYIGAVSSRSSYTVLANSGVQGPAGANGTNGSNGAAGANGISITNANIVSGNLVLTFSNSSTLNVGVVVGANGTNGSNGTNGTNGSNGTNGTNGSNGVSITNANIVSGNLVLTFSNSSTLNVGTVVGTNGTNANTGNFTFSNTTMSAANSKLEFNSFGATTIYLATTADDTTTLLMGTDVTELRANSYVSIATDTSNTSYTWTFGLDGVLALPGPVTGNAAHTIGNTTINGTLTVTGNVAGNTAGFAIGYRDIPQNFTNTSLTLALTDAGKHILTQNSGSSTQTITIANNATVAFQTGAAITIVVQSTGTVAVANGAGVTMYLTGNSTAKSTVTLNSYSMATLLKIGIDTWMVSGTGAT
jgi:hypothetical protein